MKSGALVAMAAALAMALASCGSDDEKKSGSEAQKPSRLAFKLSGAGKKAAFTAPKTAKGGLVEIALTNATKGQASAQLVRTDTGHTAQEALRAASAWGEKGEALPKWVHAAGGLGDVKPGQTGTVTQELEPGDYTVVDLESDANVEFKVTGAGAGGTPSAAATITAQEYSFEAKGLKAGKNKVLFDNKGAQPHFIAAVQIKPGKTIADVRKFVKTEKGEPPVDEKSGFSTAVIDGGLKQGVELGLKSGKYALLCFVPDREGGPPHAAKGMISEATVR